MNDAMAKSNMAAVGHDEIFFFFFLGICMCDNSNYTEFGAWNSFLILFSPFGVIFTFKDNGQGY